MKKKLLILLTFACVACLSAVLLTGCSSSNEEAESSEDKSADISTLIVGFDNSYPPYGFMDENNEPTGFDLDLAAEVANRNGWELQLEAIDWDAKDALLNQDSITASGMALPWKAVKTTTPSQSPTCSTSKLL